MNSRPFGKSGTRVSEIGIGTWQIGGTEWGDVTDEQALETLAAAADAGVFRQKPAAVVFDKASRQGVAIIVRLPLASGLLSGKITRQTTFAPTDHRAFNRDGQSFNVGETFAGLGLEKGVELSDALKPMLVRRGGTMAQCAMRWCLDFPAVTTVIPGAKRPAQARENAGASDLAPLDADTHRKLKAFYDEKVAQFIRGAY